MFSKLYFSLIYLYQKRMNWKMCRIFRACQASSHVSEKNELKEYTEGVWKLRFTARIRKEWIESEERGKHRHLGEAYQKRMNWKLSLRSSDTSSKIIVSEKNELKGLVKKAEEVDETEYQKRMNWKAAGYEVALPSLVKCRYQKRMNWK